MGRRIVTFNDIQTAAAGANPTDISGKNYIPVSERVLAFRRLFPLGAIETEIKEDGDTCTCVARVSVPAFEILGETEDPAARIILATGTAQEKRGDGRVNRTSHVENCETSAVGRALGFLGLGIENGIASADEVASAKEADDGLQKIDTAAQKALLERCKAAGVDLDGLLNLYKAKSVQDLNYYQYSNINQFWDKISLKRAST